MAKITQAQLREHGLIAAEAYDECDKALEQLNAGFGVVYESARSNLLEDVKQASKQGMDLSIFSGKTNLLRYEEVQTNIVVRVSKVPTAHQKLLKLDERIADLERALKVAKAERDYMIKQLSLKGDIDLITDKINLAFTRIK